MTMIFAKHMRALGMLIGVVASPLGVLAAETNETKSAHPLKVLMIGNSFSQPVLHHAPQVVRNLGCKLDLTSMFIGGSEMKKHVQNFECCEKEPEFRSYLVQSRWCSPVPAGLNGKRGLPETLTAAAWDIVTVQQASHCSAVAKTYEPWADLLIGYVRKYAPKAEIVLQQTWSYSRTAEDDWEKMYAGLTECYGNLAKRHGLRIIPTGLAVQLYRRDRPVSFVLPCKAALEKITTPEAVPVTDDVVGNYTLEKVSKDGEAMKLHSDPYHLNPTGEYLQGLVWIGRLFGVDPCVCTYAPKDMDPTVAAACRKAAAGALRGEIPASSARK